MVATTPVILAAIAAAVATRHLPAQLANAIAPYGAGSDIAEIPFATLQQLSQYLRSSGGKADQRKYYLHALMVGSTVVKQSPIRPPPSPELLERRRILQNRADEYEYQRILGSGLYLTLILILILILPVFLGSSCTRARTLFWHWFCWHAHRHIICAVMAALPPSGLAKNVAARDRAAAQAPLDVVEGRRVFSLVVNLVSAGVAACVLRVRDGARSSCTAEPGAPPQARSGEREIKGDFAIAAYIRNQGEGAGKGKGEGQLLTWMLRSSKRAKRWDDWLGFGIGTHRRTKRGMSARGFRPPVPELCLFLSAPWSFTSPFPVSVANFNIPLHWVYCILCWTRWVGRSSRCLRALRSGGSRREPSSPGWLVRVGFPLFSFCFWGFFFC